MINANQVPTEEMGKQVASTRDPNFDRQTDRNLLRLYAYMYSYSLVVVVFADGCAFI
jgi:hypothetical protein